ncbi:MAG: glycerophosphodiester phosphodiesterase [Ilumatobacteraceae bacterium]
MGVSGMSVPPQVIAHRGASRAEHENTIDAFRRARAMGSDAVELDVRRTRDGILVVHHNPELPDGRVIADTEHADLPPEVPTLPAALDACAGMWVNVEIKNDPAEADFDETDEIAERTMDALLDRGEHERWLISSFRIETIDRCRAIADAAQAAVRTAWLTVDVPPGTPDLLVARGHSALHPWVGTLDRDVVDACHGHGLAVNTWTCDEPERMRELAEWGVDGICTNVPDVARAALSER